MSISILVTTLAAAAAPGGGGAFFMQIAPLLFVFVMLSYLVICPRQRRRKRHAAEIAAVKMGDEVVTAGGIRGKVTKVSDDEVEVETAQGTKVRIVKSTLSHVLTKNAKPAND